jgi:hypothetical protein
VHAASTAGESLAETLAADAGEHARQVTAELPRGDELIDQARAAARQGVR